MALAVVGLGLQHREYERNECVILHWTVFRRQFGMLIQVCITSYEECFVCECQQLIFTWVCLHLYVELLETCVWWALWSLFWFSLKDRGFVSVHSVFQINPNHFAASWCARMNPMRTLFVIYFMHCAVKEKGVGSVPLTCFPRTCVFFCLFFVSFLGPVSFFNLFSFSLFRSFTLGYYIWILLFFFADWSENCCQNLEVCMS